MPAKYHRVGSYKAGAPANRISRNNFGKRYNTPFLYFDNRFLDYTHRPQILSSWEFELNSEIRAADSLLIFLVILRFKASIWTFCSQLIKTWLELDHLCHFLRLIIDCIAMGYHHYSIESETNGCQTKYPVSASHKSIIGLLWESPF